MIMMIIIMIILVYIYIYIYTHTAFTSYYTMCMYFQTPHYIRLYHVYMCLNATLYNVLPYTYILKHPTL